MWEKEVTFENSNFLKRSKSLLLGFESLKRSIHSSFDGEDAFSELGPPVALSWAQSGSPLSKLLTEKHEPYLKLQNQKSQAGCSSYAESQLRRPEKNRVHLMQKVSSKLSSQAGCSRTLGEPSPSCPKPEKNDITGLSAESKCDYNFNAESQLGRPGKNMVHLMQKVSSQAGCSRTLGEPSPSCPKPEKNDTTGLSAESKCDYNFNDSNSISIENVPTTVGLAQLIEAVLIYGKVSSACMRTSPNGLDFCVVEFENLSSSRRAVTAGLVKIRGNCLPIRPLHVQETLKIRISGISKETTDPAIHALCKSIGPLEGMVRAGEDVVYAIFSLKNNPDIQGVLAKLNDTLLDECKWSACLPPRNSIPAVNSKLEDAKSRLVTEIDTCLEAVKAKHSLYRIHIEDAEYLHMMITHLEGGSAIGLS